MSHLELLNALPEHEVASLLGVEIATLRNWRSKRSGPAYSRPGGTIFYPVASLRKWVEDNVVEPSPVAVPELTETAPRRGPGRPRKVAAA